MSAKHTPGPWKFETVKTVCGICHKVGPFPGKRQDDKPRHACLYADYPSNGNPADDELEANARLISAAPELLEALVLIKSLPGFEESEPYAAVVNAAIAKATQ